MRIAFVTDAYIPVPSGTAVSIEILKVALEKLGHEVFIFAPEYPGLRHKEKRVARLPSIFSLTNPYAPIVFPVFSPNKKLIKKLGLDIVHSHYFFRPFNFAKSLADAAGVPLVSTFYKIFPEYARQNKSIFSGFDKILNQTIRFANSCDHIIALSQTSRNYLADLNITASMTVLPVGIFLKDYTSFPPQAIKEKFNIPPSRKLLLYVARCEDDANMILLLKAFKRVWKALDDVHLLIVGGGRKFNDYRRLAHLQLFNQYVTFTGFLPKNLVNKIYGAADVFVYPKTLDPEPLAVIESLAAGTPVVAVKGLGAQDFVSDNQDGLISSVSVEEFADKIIELTRRNKMRLEFSLRARANAKRFRASNLTCDLVELYESVISRNKDKFF